MHLLKKISCIYIVIICTTFIANAQPVQWTWMGGDISSDSVGIYGTKGVASATNYPGARFGSISFSDKSGNFWIFGGNGADKHGKIGILNDLWKWDGTFWTWVSGNDTINSNGIRKTHGTPDPSNLPGARQFGAGGIDYFGKLWIFGGEGFFGDPGNMYTSGSSDLNDIWMYDGSSWTWFKGGDGYNDSLYEGGFYVSSVYGIQGTPSTKNHPSIRHNCLNWMDQNNNLWVYGGYINGGGALSDLWKWNGINWTYISGDTTLDEPPRYTAKGAASSYNSPGGRSMGSAFWTDKDGAFWLFGGETSQGKYNPPKNKNDLWKFDGHNWIWISGSDTGSPKSNFGIKGIANSTNYPGSRIYASGWSDSVSNIWIFGGTYFLGAGLQNDLWKWDGLNWTWVKGSDTTNQVAIMGPKGKTDQSYTPGSIWKAMASTDRNGKLILFGGANMYSNFYNPLGHINTLWTWDGNNWAWLNGSESAGTYQSGVYGQIGVPSPLNWPGARADAASWTDSRGDFWLFGGSTSQNWNYASLETFNDLWKFDGKNWTWMSGPNLKNQPGNYGIKGSSSPYNYPGQSNLIDIIKNVGGSGFNTFINSVGWSDKLGNQWLYGGLVKDTSDGKNMFIDFWKWDGSNWSWHHKRNLDSSYIFVPNTSIYRYNYPTPGVPDTTNYPPYYRKNFGYWTDKNDNLWILGGNRYDGVNGVWNIADQWKWDGKAWTLVYVDTLLNEFYGTKGVADSKNFPGARDGMVIWKDSSDNVWMFGGRYNFSSGPRGGIPNSYNNDLWKWDGKAWTWISGSKTFDINKNSNYGTLGISAATNLPPERYNATGWISPNGNLWLFGGYGFTDGVSYDNFLNDLWVWDGKNWTWMGGSKTTNQYGIYGQKGIASINNTPGARYKSMSWIDKSGDAWLFGGWGDIQQIAFVPYYLNSNFRDLWKFSTNVITAINPLTPSTNPSSKIKLLSNPSSVNKLQFITDQFYQKLNWQIFDEYGRALQQGDLQIVLKNSLEVLPINHLEKGIYFIKFQGDKKSIQTFKWIRL